jgi:hypothetical protein
MSSKEQKYILTMQKDIRSGLRAIDMKGNWLDAYNQWRNEEKNQFFSLLMIKDPFNPSCAGDSYTYDRANPDHMVDLDIMSMSVFLSEHLMKMSRDVFSQVRTARNRDKKVLLINSYFDIVDSIVNSRELAGCIVTLNEAAEKQMALQGARSVDLYVCFYSLRELLRKETTESLYLLYTYWRITKSRKILKNLINAIIDYIRVYFEDFDHDPEMHLHYPLDGLMTVKKLAVVSHWLEIIAFHTDGIFDKYKGLNWLAPTDTMADDIVETAQISKFEMLNYKRVFINDDNETVRKKAIGNHGYATWIKTVDVMHIFYYVCQVLCYLPGEDLKKMNTTKAAMIELYDNMTKIKNYYTGKVFFHQVYFELERKYIDSQVMNALEEDAQLLADSVDDVIAFVEAISSDDIENLMQAKQRYIERLKNFTTEEQEEELDKLTVQIVEKVKSAISKKDIYDELYAAVSDEFEPYLSVLAKFPSIFSSLVSAEYLYKQYVEGQEPRENFDYSCISIMYYMSLEDFLNKLVYIPYSKKVLSEIDEMEAKNNWKKYVSKYTNFWGSWKNPKLKNSCEIGVLGFLLEGIDVEEYLQKFFADQYHVTDINPIKSFGKLLKSKAPRRNQAAHGGNYLKYEDVCVDKENIYDVVNEYRGMILELLEILYPSS